jgi:DNA-binding transcriptional LysR family regulator
VTRTWPGWIKPGARLVRPFDLVVDTGDAYYLTWPQARPAHPKLAAFSHWLRDEIRKQPYA